SAARARAPQPAAQLLAEPSAIRIRSRRARSCWSGRCGVGLSRAARLRRGARLDGDVAVVAQTEQQQLHGVSWWARPYRVVQLGWRGHGGAVDRDDQIGL